MMNINYKAIRWLLIAFEDRNEVYVLSKWLLIELKHKLYQITIIITMETKP